MKQWSQDSVIISWGLRHRQTRGEYACTTDVQSLMSALQTPMHHVSFCVGEVPGRSLQMSRKRTAGSLWWLWRLPGIGLRSAPSSAADAASQRVAATDPPSSVPTHVAPPLRVSAALLGRKAAFADARPMPAVAIWLGLYTVGFFTGLRREQTNDRTFTPPDYFANQQAGGLNTRSHVSF